MNMFLNDKHETQARNTKMWKVLIFFPKTAAMGFMTRYVKLVEKIYHGNYRLSIYVGIFVLQSKNKGSVPLPPFFSVLTNCQFG